MGGCRCSYRTCKATSDGNTHFFHYPVFDKHRCHQWIANAQRFDLLELKLSQLKNRVICQHHFQDNMFMNDKRNKLTHNAVPTLDGPLVAVKSLPQAPPIVPAGKSASNTLQEIVTNKEKIEDDTKYFTSREKIATFSVPYNEFLKKCDLDQLNDPDLLKSMPTPRRKQPLYTNRLIVTEPQTDSRTDGVDVPTNNLQPQAQSLSVKRAEGNKQKKNVVIVAEKKITNQLPIKPSLGDLKEVSPNFVIKKPKKVVVERESASRTVTANLPNTPKKLQEGNTNSNEHNIIIPEYYTQDRADASLTVQTPSSKAITVQKSLQTHSEDSNKYLPQIVSVNSIPSAANNSVVHPTIMDVEFVPEVARVPSEQAPAAATPQKPTKNSVSTSAEKINTVPEYSSTLREVVEKALSRLDDQRRKQLQSMSPHLLHRPQTSPVSFKSKHICKNPKKPNSLTAALLSKVKENSRDIAEIKHLLQEQVKSTTSKSVKVVKDKNEEVYSNPDKRKKYLFEEISQYLSTKLKSDLYEELFINHLVPKTRSISTRRKTSPKFT